MRHVTAADLAAAVAEAEQARAFGSRVADPKDRALITLQLALALDASRRDPTRARALTSEAAAVYGSVLRSPRDERDLARATSFAAR